MDIENVTQQATRFQMFVAHEPLPLQVYIDALEEAYQNTLALLDAASSYIYQDLMNESIQVALKPQILLKKERIERAIERIQRGTYGKCCKCARPIWERLEAIPFAELCIECQGKYNSMYRWMT